MSIAVVADADTLFPAATRGLLIYLDYQGVIKLHWSVLILDEVSRVLVDTGRKKSLKDARAHEDRMCDALPNALVAVEDVQAQFKTVAPAVRSAKDVHVAACAYALHALRAYPGDEVVALVTRNSKDFRKHALTSLGIALRKPDEFLLGLLDTASGEFASAFRRFRMDLASKPAPEALLARLDKDGLERTARKALDLHLAGHQRF